MRAYVCAATLGTDRIVHETGVIQEGLEEAASPLSSDSDGRVVPIRGHVRGDEHPLRERLLGQVFVK